MDDEDKRRKKKMVEKDIGWILLANKGDIPKVKEVIEQLFPGIEVNDANNNGHHFLSVSGKGAETFFALVRPIKQVV